MALQAMHQNHAAFSAAMEAQNRLMTRLEESYAKDYKKQFEHKDTTELDIRSIMSYIEDMAVEWIKNTLGDKILVLLAPMKQSGVSFWEDSLRRGNWKVVWHILDVMLPDNMGEVTRSDGSTVFEVCAYHKIPIGIMEAVMKKAPSSVWLRTGEDGVMKSLAFIKHEESRVKELAMQFIPDQARAHPDFWSSVCSEHIIA